MSATDAGRASFSHDPVMRDEIVDVFADVPPGTILDATLGGGGHTEALLESREDLDVIGLDRDPDAIAARRLIKMLFGLACRISGAGRILGT